MTGKMWAALKVIPFHNTDAKRDIPPNPHALSQSRGKRQVSDWQYTDSLLSKPISKLTRLSSIWTPKDHYMNI